MFLRFRMNPMRIGAFVCSVLVATTAVSAQTVRSGISLARPSPASAFATPRGEASFANPPANFYGFSSARVGSMSSLETVTLRFDAATTIQSIKSTPDFPVEAGGSCEEGRSYGKGDTCMVLVRFTPQGAGRRLGKLTISNTASATPAAIGLGGYGYAPVVSFTPSIITTVPGTYVSNAGLLKSAQNLYVDGGDTLYIADTGNGDIRYIDSSGTVQNAITGATTPEGIATDNFGNIFFDNGAASGFMYEIYNYATFDVQASGTGTDTCNTSTPCSMYAEQLYYPGMMSVDHNNNLLFANENGGAALSDLQPSQPTFINLYDPFPYQEAALPDGFAADYNDNLYTLWAIGTECEIQQQSLYDAELSNVRFVKVAGGRMCGFSGDGGEAANAEIGTLVGQMAFDEAGDLYFTDTNNQRVRMINAATGIISTIAGSGTAGYSGDNGTGPAAKLSFPTGVGVDSQGQVYIISGTGTTAGGAQVVRKLGVKGDQGFGSQTVGTTSVTHFVTVTNTGNSTMTLTNTAFTGTNAGDFSIDPTATTCVLTAGGYLYAGQSCKLGLLFKPSATGARSANFVLLNNTVTGTNVVMLSGTGAAAAAQMIPGTLTFPATVQNYTTSAAVTLKNTGNAALTLSSVAVSGTNAAMFSSTSSCGASVAPGATCTLHVTFKPSSTGSYSASLKVTDNAPNSPQSIALKGSGVTTVASTIKLAPVANPAAICQPVSFGVTVGGTGAGTPTGTITLKNGATVLATGTLSSGAATLSTTKLTAGTSQVTATYGGDSTHAPSTSAELAQTVSTGTCTVAKTGTLGSQL